MVAFDVVPENMKLAVEKGAEPADSPAQVHIFSERINNFKFYNTFYSIFFMMKCS